MFMRRSACREQVATAVHRQPIRKYLEGTCISTCPTTRPKEQGQAVAADEPATSGQRRRDGGCGPQSPFEAEVRWPYPTPKDVTSWSMTHSTEYSAVLRPSVLCSERHHGRIPTIGRVEMRISDGRVLCSVAS